MRGGKSFFSSFCGWGERVRGWVVAVGVVCKENDGH
jgi:hypothetical protein